MDERTRRGILAGLAAGTAGLAGCTGLVGRGGGGTGTPTDTPVGTSTATSSPSSTPGPDTLRLTRVEDVGDGTAVVYPERLRTWLRRAARNDGPVRVHTEVDVPMPEPVLPRFEAVALQTGDGSLDGTYAVDCEGGTRYRILVGAQSVEDVPEDATVTPLSELPQRRRELALLAIGNGRAKVYPETPLGEWVRKGWFEGYFRHDGAVYRGTEIQQTDAAFFSEELWMTLSLSPAAASDVEGPTLRFPDLDPAVREFVDGALADWGKSDEEASRTTDGLPGPVRSFAAETDHLLTHTAAFEVAAIRVVG